jgi:TPR repeat protein
MRAFLTLIVVLSSLAAPRTAAAGPLEDGIAAFERFDFSSAREALEPISTQGDARAQVVLGKMYLRGLGVPLNGFLAAKWFRLAALQGNADAQDNLGLLYFRGRGVRLDHAEAAKWFRLAAEQGNTDAQQCLGALYAVGAGVPQDYVLAHVWYSLAASASGNALAVGARDLLASKMTPEQLARASDMLKALHPARHTER